MHKNNPAFSLELEELPFDNNEDGKYINPIDYEIYNLDALLAFLDILEKELYINIHEDLTYLLYRCLKLCKSLIFSLNISSFPCTNFNNLLHGYIKEMNREDDDIKGINVNIAKNYEIFAAVLLANNVNYDDVESYFFQYITKR